MNHRRSTLYPLVGILIVAALQGCNLVIDDYVPSQQEIEIWVSPFLVDATEVTGIYGNRDVDCLVFTYSSAFETHAKFEQTIKSALENSEWTRTLSDSDVIEYRRQRGLGYEVCRLAPNPRTGVVTVGWIQADLRIKDERFEESSEGKWATDYFWPIFDKARNQTHARGTAE